jgi:hypothetical protein
MPRRESENHEAAAFSLGLPPSSQNGLARLRGTREALSTAWVIGLVLSSSLLCGSLLADTTAFVRVAALFDHQALVWLEAIFGYLCMVSVSLNLRQQHMNGGSATSSLLLSVLAFTSYSYHLFLLRWPWLTGEAEVHSRYAVWSAVLSSTWRGVPALAFGELLGIAVLLTHGFVGLSVTSPWQRLGRAIPRLRLALGAVGLVTYLLASAVIITLATGRR